MIHITKPLLGEAEQKLVCEVLASGWVTQGPKVAAFEKAFAEYTGARYAVAVNNCTAALHLAVMESGVGPGDEVICPSLTFIATANAILYCGGKPVFAEVKAEDFNIDPAAIEPLITERTKAVMVVHQIGNPARMEEICRIADRHGLVVIEDAACAIGSGYRGAKIGKPFGKFVCFSFHPRKVITTGEGGMITTDDAEADQQFRLLRQHGMSVPDTVRHAAKSVIFESYVRVGYNYRMSDIHAAVGLGQLARLDEIVAGRQRIAARYDAAFGNLPGVKLVDPPDGSELNYQNYSLLLTDQAKVSRDQFMQAMLDKGVSTRKGIMTIHREPAYANLCAGLRLPVTEYASDHSVLLPVFPQMTEAEQAAVVEATVSILG